MEQDVENEYRTVCSTCLSSDRDLFALNNINVPQAFQIFKLLMYDFAGDRLGEMAEISHLICWECLALMKRFYKFKWQVHNAQEHIRVLALSQETMDHTYMSQSLSTLVVETKSDYDKIFFDYTITDCQYIVSDGMDVKNEQFIGLKDTMGIDVEEHILEVPETLVLDGNHQVFSHMVLGANTLISSTNAFGNVKTEQMPSLTITPMTTANLEAGTVILSKQPCKTEAEPKPGYTTEYMSEADMLTSRCRPKKLPVKPSCKHGREKKELCCTKLTLKDIKTFHKMFYNNPNKITQNTFLLKYCICVEEKETPYSLRGLPRTCRNTKKKSIKYYVPKQYRGRTKLIRVCLNALTKILHVSKWRMKRVTKHATIKIKRESQDRDTNASMNPKENVRRFIMNLKLVESHYVGKTKFQYLSSDLNVRKLWKVYNKEHIDGVTYEYFRMIFTNEFNISFKTPATEPCFKCTLIRDMIKTEDDQRKKSLLMAQLRVHKLRTKWFRSNLKTEKENEVTFSFGCQKNLPLPKLPEQVTLSQLDVYNFTICQGTGPYTTNNTFIYTWLESEGFKGSNQIVSALHHRLSNTYFTEATTHIRLMCSIGGQNKSSILLGMLAHWLKVESPDHIKKITLNFPVVGHSFLPPNKVFSNIEKHISKKTILTPDEYFQIFSEFGTVLRLDKDFKFFDWKTAVYMVVNMPENWHFNLKFSKRLFLRKGRCNQIAVKGEPNYRSEVTKYGNICRKNRVFEDITPLKLKKGVTVNAAKCKDIWGLLENQFGSEWYVLESLRFFSNLLGRSASKYEDVGLVSTSKNHRGMLSEETDDESTLMDEIEDLRV